MNKDSKHRPCERQCRSCGYWKHHNRFHSWKDKRIKHSNGSVAVTFSPDCRKCEQKQRNLNKNKDRALAIMKNRARHHGAKHNLSFEFMWITMNWRSLVPILRAMMTPEALCPNCGHHLLNERDIHIEHRDPSRFTKDFARLHARNIGFFCDSCNKSKGKKPFTQWLDEEEEARLSNEANPSPNPSLEKEERDLFSLAPRCGSNLELLLLANQMPETKTPLFQSTFL